MTIRNKKLITITSDDVIYLKYESTPKTNIFHKIGYFGGDFYPDSNRGKNIAQSSHPESFRGRINCVSFWSVLKYINLLKF